MGNRSGIPKTVLQKTGGTMRTVFTILGIVAIVGVVLIATRQKKERLDEFEEALS